MTFEIENVYPEVVLPDYETVTTVTARSLF